MSITDENWQGIIHILTIQMYKDVVKRTIARTAFKSCVDCTETSGSSRLATVTQLIQTQITNYTYTQHVEQTF